jgi:hypothetical protein
MVGVWCAADQAASRRGRSAQACVRLILNIVFGRKLENTVINNALWANIENEDFVFTLP